MLIYVAGPYRGRSRFRLIRFFQVLRNIWRARRVAAELWGMGFVAVCPHLNTLLMDNICPQEWFLEGDLDILARCDAVVLVPGYATSTGTLGEIDVAVRRGIPIYSVQELREMQEQLRERVLGKGAEMAEIEGIEPDVEL